MNILLLSAAIILLIGYMLFLGRRKDYHLLLFPPVTKNLPRSKYEQALKELNDFIKQPKPKSRRKQIERNSEQYYLEQRLKQALNEIESEQKSYYLACKEREIAWRDYYNFFKNMSFIEKFILPSKIKELLILRNLYLDSEKRVELELGKFNAQSRVRFHEEKTLQDREKEISQKTKSAALVLPNDSEEQQIPSDEIIRNGFEEMKLHDDSYLEIDEIESEPINQPNSIEQTITESRKTEVRPNTNTTFCQADFLEKIPDFSGLSYIDESFSMEEIGLSVVLDANFDRTFFVSILFTGRHQYKDCSFVSTDFSYSIWQRSAEPHRILNSTFQDSKFCFARFEVIAFYNCSFILVDFTGTQFQTVKFVNCVFEECNLKDVDFSKTVMSSDMLEKIDFSDCLKPPKNISSTNQKEKQTDQQSENNKEEEDPIPIA
ncbi:pentapeptide repeat-containing protein [bacterium]|nr:pentapeptide repeat-containing protein [bacterium]